MTTHEQTARAKLPRLIPIEGRMDGCWLCVDATVSCRGVTPKDAYDGWLMAAIIEAQPVEPVKAARRARAPRPKPAPAVKPAPTPAAALDIPVFVAPARTSNALQRPPLSLSSVGLRLNGERALAAQPKTPSLSGGRRGGE